MKKLIVAIGIAALAVSVQAASYYWKATSMTDMAGNVLSGDVAMSVYCTTLDNKLVSSANVSGGTITAGETTKFSDDSFVAGTVYRFVVEYTDSAGNKFVSKEMGSKAQATSTPTISFTPSGGTWTAVPEPTTGLLLLAGIAGLALRRKRV